MDEATLRQRICKHLERIYPDLDTSSLLDEVLAALGVCEDFSTTVPVTKWDESDVIAITYGDTFRVEGEKPLRTLLSFLNTHLNESISSVHVLPFFPYSSDDGFAVINYLQVNDALGEWQDIEAISDDFGLMVDLVINHASSRSSWFSDFKRGVAPGKDYFVTVPEDTDVSNVVRPRPMPVLQPVQTLKGIQWVWCTFGPDQVDLDFSNPDVLVEFIQIMASYIDAGARFLRMDAVAFLWKEPGTACIHLPQTHEVIKLLRLLAEVKNPGTVIVTETNVPNRENLTYFGNANEAHAIYNFSLPPLLVQTLLTGNCRHLKTWMMSMPPAQLGTCYLNFIATHDGIGLRPAEGLLEEQELTDLLTAFQQFGGHISTRAGADGQEHPYEANIALWDALKGTIANGADEYQFQRFICAHTIMFGLEGIPAVYIHSFLATPNDSEYVEKTGRYRSINRHIFEGREDIALVSSADRSSGRVLREVGRILKIRRCQPAFHPNAVQFTLHLGLELFAFWRQSLDRSQNIFCISNVTSSEQVVQLSDINLISTQQWVDLLGGIEVQDLAGSIVLGAYQSIWLSNTR